MEETRVTYRRTEQAAGSRAEGLSCLICGRTFWAQPLVWTYVAEAECGGAPPGRLPGAPLRYAHVHHDGEISPLEFAASPIEEPPHRGAWIER
jgi:hypothetical protein